REEALERPEAQGLVGQLAQEQIALRTGRQPLLHAVHDLPQPRKDPWTRRRIVELAGIELGEVEEVEQAAMDVTSQRDVGQRRRTRRELLGSRPRRWSRRSGIPRDRRRLLARGCRLRGGPIPFADRSDEEAVSADLDRGAVRD